MQLLQSNKSYVLIGQSLKFTSLAHMLEGTGLSEEALHSDEKISLQAAIQIVHNLNRYSESPIWPAIFGRHLGIATHGPVGYAAVSAPTLGKALSTFVEWFQVRSETYRGTIIETDDAFEIEIIDLTGDSTFKAFYFESYMRAFEILISLIMGKPPLGETALYFEVPPENRKPLMEAEYFSELYFGHSCNKLRVSKSIWFQPSPLYDKDSHEFNLRKCQQLFEEMDSLGRIDLQVRNAIRQSIEQRIAVKAIEGCLPSLAKISQGFNQSERTLTRKLSVFGTSYSDILGEERRSFAEKLLEEARYSVLNVAEILGYTEVANFSRAFKNWFGTSPRAYRQRARE